ncbi:ABC transporter permease [Mycobacterium paraterrae]|uniref:ABC transporter permease n=1 Tax=Mycobacterium paraterrae TaxID=577492 RepID=A0ABY3VG54_9MYCO|nr:ABC transporter permease [Mycobacterium paraterrae]UMB68331.1 ABC transporter permease [Mycobacterium paraterrae]
MAADQGLIRPPRSAAVSLRRLGPALLLLPPLGWLTVAYLASMAVLLVSAFWLVNDFTGEVVHAYTTGNFQALLRDPVFGTVTVRTILVALAVTALDAVLAVPVALFMAKIASPRARVPLVVAVTTPLWANYLVKAYAWRGLLAPSGLLDWLTGDQLAGYGLAATIVTLAYLWLPYMILPVFTAFARVPDSLLEASADLGARSGTTLRRVAAPLIFPGIAAGSVFTFSLSLGDYIAVQIVGGKAQLLGNVIYGQLVTANNQPLAAALCYVPLAAVLVYLFALRATGALEEDS